MHGDAGNCFVYSHNEMPPDDESTTPMPAIDAVSAATIEIIGKQGSHDEKYESAIEAAANKSLVGNGNNHRTEADTHHRAAQSETQNECLIKKQIESIECLLKIRGEFIESCVKKESANQMLISHLTKKCREVDQQRWN